MTGKARQGEHEEEEEEEGKEGLLSSLGAGVAWHGMAWHGLAWLGMAAYFLRTELAYMQTSEGPVRPSTS